VHGAIVKLDPRSNKWTLYPMPQANQSLPKFEVAPDNTLWFGSRRRPEHHRRALLSERLLADDPGIALTGVPHSREPATEDR
jgi:hypothetical protein